MGHYWWARPKTGDIVWCYFPQNKIMRPGPKPRPVLITNIFLNAPEQFLVRVIYGTSQKTDKLFSGEFLIARADGAAWQTSGLMYETKFNFTQTVDLPYNSDWFAVPPAAPHGQTPKLGLLHPALFRRAEAAWKAVKDKDK